MKGMDRATETVEGWGEEVKPCFLELCASLNALSATDENICIQKSVQDVNELVRAQQLLDVSGGGGGNKVKVWAIVVGYLRRVMRVEGYVEASSFRMNATRFRELFYS